MCKMASVGSPVHFIKEKKYHHIKFVQRQNDRDCHCNSPSYQKGRHDKNSDETENCLNLEKNL